MATDAVTSNANDYPRTRTTQTLLWIAGAEVLFFWGFLILALIAVVMFVAGVWSGLKPWQLDGLRVVIAKPIYRPDVADVKFDDFN